MSELLSNLYPHTDGPRSVSRPVLVSQSSAQPGKDLAMLHVVDSQKC